MHSCLFNYFTISPFICFLYKICYCLLNWRNIRKFSKPKLSFLCFYSNITINHSWFHFSWLYLRVWNYYVNIWSSYKTNKLQILLTNFEDTFNIFFAIKYTLMLWNLFALDFKFKASYNLINIFCNLSGRGNIPIICFIPPIPPKP